MGRFRFFRWLNKNLKVLIIGILALVFVILILQILNNSAQKEKESKRNTIQSNTVNTLSKSVISDNKLAEPVYNNNKKIIEEFTEYCNSGDIQAAYDLISTDCKENLYKDLQEFKENYYDKIFAKKRNCTVQYWDNSIYEVKFSEDMLSTGKSSKTNGVTDYIRIGMENQKNKISINGFLGKKKIEKEKKIKGVTVKIVNRYIYMDYETYDIQIKNDSGETLILDSQNQLGTMYLVDKKGTKHNSVNNEIIKDNLVVQNNHVSLINIKFNNPYIKDRKIDKIVFSNVGIGYEERNGSKPFSSILNFEIEINND